MINVHVQQYQPTQGVPRLCNTFSCLFRSWNELKQLVLTVALHNLLILSASFPENTPQRSNQSRAACMNNGPRLKSLLVARIASIKQFRLVA
jgi:hypothetical protein